MKSDIPVEKLSGKEIKTMLVNKVVADIVEAYLEYASKIVREAFKKEGYDAMKFKEVGDELVLTPNELIELVDKLQVAFSEI